MKLLELFAGTRSVSKVFEARGHITFSVDWNKDFENITLYEDINNLSAHDIIKLCGENRMLYGQVQIVVHILLQQYLITEQRIK